MTKRLEYNDEQIRHVLETIINKTGDATEVMSAIGGEMIKNVEDNFAAGGRYSSPHSIIGGNKRWRPHSRNTIRIKRKKGMAGPHQLLIESGGMASSISKKVDKTTVEVGTNKEYAKTQHFGAKKGQFGIHDVLFKAHTRRISNPKPGGKSKADVKEHRRKVRLPWGNIPARPFMTIHPDSIKDMHDMLADYILSLD